MANQVGGSIVWNLDVDAKKFDAGMDQAKTTSAKTAAAVQKSVGAISFNGLATSAGSAFSSISSGIENVAKKLTLLSVGTGGIGTLFLKSAADLQQTSKSFEVLTGNIDVSNKLFAQLAEYANQTPFQFSQISKAGRTLLGFGINADQVFDRVKVLGDIAAATGADFEHLAVVYGQVNAAGRLMGQDSLQLINNNIPITNILTKKLGISARELRDRIEEGAVSADVFNEALLETTKQGGFAFKGTDTLAQSLNGRISTLKDTVLEFGRNLLGVKVDPALGLVVEPGGIFDRFSQLVPRITENLKQITPRVKAAFDFLLRNGNTIKAILGGIAAAYTAAKLAAIGFSIAAAINPFTLIAAAVVAFVGLMVFLELKFKLLSRAFAALKPVIDPVVEVFKFLWAELKQRLAPAIEFVSKHIELFKNIGLILMGVLLAPLAVAIGIAAGAFAILIGAIIGIIEYFKLLINIGKFVVDQFKQFWQSLKDAVKTIGDALSSAGRIVKDAFSGAGTWLVDAGKEIINGLINGLKAGFNKVKSTLGDLTNKIKDWKGPLSTDKKLLTHTGTVIIGGLVKGLESQYPTVQNSLQSLTSTLPELSASISTLPLEQTAPTTTSQTTQPQAPVNVTLNMSGIMTRSQSDKRELAKDMLEAVNQELRSRRLPEIGNGNLSGAPTV